MGLEAAVHLGHMLWALTKEEEEEEVICYVLSGSCATARVFFKLLYSWVSLVMCVRSLYLFGIYSKPGNRPGSVVRVSG
jgi:hypothetical protein